MSRKFSLLALVGAVAVAAAVSAGYSGSARSATSSVTPLPSSSCGPVVYKGSGSPDFIVASDLPLQGAIRAQTVQISRAMIWALAGRGLEGRPVQDRLPVVRRLDRAGRRVGLGQVRDERAPLRRATSRSSACRDVQLRLREDQVPILNRANPGPLGDGQPGEHEPGPDEEVGLRVSRTSTTRPACATTPASSRPTTIQGPADALWTKSLGIKKVYVLNDKQTYGFGVATTYETAAKKLGITVVGFQGWDAKPSSYEALADGDQGVGRAGRLPRRHRLQQRREADAGHQVRRSEDPAADA